MSNVYNIGIIGVGRWGTNYFRTFNELDNAKVKWICATKENSLKEALSKIKPRHIVKTTTNYKDLLRDKEVDAVAIVSHGSTHYNLAREVLQSNKHVIVEKPLAFHSKDVKELIKISNDREKILMVGHLHRYNAGIQKLKSDIKNGLLGKINFVHLSQFGNGPVRTDMNALWDFFPHSVSILLYLLDKYPLSLSVNGASYINNGIEDIVAMDILFPNKIFATSMASWLYPLKKMEITIAGEKLFATFDDYLENEKLKYWNTKKNKCYIAPELKDSKPLKEQLKHFLECIKSRRTPLTNGKEALKVVKVLEAAQKSLKNHGLTIKLNK